MAVHTAGLFLLLDRPALWLTADPILNADWGLHYHHIQSMVAFWKVDHRLWGYNPLFMAGYPSNTFQDWSIKFFELAALLTPSIPPIQAFKLWILFATALIPCIAYLTFRIACKSHPSSRLGGLIMASLATAYWWNSFPREMFYYGMVGFPIACHLTFMAVAVFHECLQPHFRWVGPAWVALGALLVPMHP